MSKKEIKFSPKTIIDSKEDNFFSALHDTLDWFYNKNFHPAFNEAAIFLQVTYEVYLIDIKAELKLQHNLDLHKKFVGLNGFIQYEKSAISKIAKNSDIKKILGELQHNINPLLTSA